MNELGIRSLVFSSSATVYGVPETLSYTETHRLAAINPYGATKPTVENILRDLCRSDPQWRVGILRYFNLFGAHASGLIGEDLRGIPNNLMPFIAQVAGGRRPHLNIWGDDFATLDGTGVRDYVHVTDLAIGHVKALDHLNHLDGDGGCFAVNIGTGQGHSVMDMVRAFESACSHTIAFKVGPSARRRSAHIFCGCHTGPHAAGLAGRTRPGQHVPGHLELVSQKPQQI